MAQPPLPFAVFVVAPVSGGIAATTRAADRGEAGRIGLPGGKVDAGELPVAAVVREAAEEGWAVRGVEQKPFHTAVVDGRPVWWYRAAEAVRLGSYKEQGRIRPIITSVEEVANSGYGNDVAMAVFLGGAS